MNYTETELVLLEEHEDGEHECSGHPAGPSDPMGETVYCDGTCRRPVEGCPGCSPRPTWTKPCERCGATVERWRGQGDVTCHRCGASYNTGGQRLRDDWRGNPSWYDDEIGDLDGFEIEHLRAEGWRW